MNVADPWQARIDRLRRLLPLPLLVLASAAALGVPGSSDHAWARLPVGLPLATASAVWWALVTWRLRGDASTRWRLLVFGVHTGLSAALVWVSPLYGVFAYVGFLFAYGLGPRWRLPGFAATALVVSGAMSGGYPSSDAGKTFTYLLVAVVLFSLVLTTASITTRALDQNQERGRMIEELAEANRRLAESMTENAALHAQLVAQAREAGVTSERQRLAGEIHDTLAQGLTGIITQLEAAEHSRRRPDDWSRHLDQARTLARSSLTEARRSVRALRPEQLEDASLPDALAALAVTWEQQSMVAADVHVAGGPMRIDADVEATLFRVTQEALSNVAKHAGAGKVRVTLTYLDDSVLLDVVDNGVGIAEPSRTRDPQNPHGYGIIGMQQRLERVGGTLTIESMPGAGTTVNATVPLPRPTTGSPS